jgi:predicted nuclease with RNAse H fold
VRFVGIDVGAAVLHCVVLDQDRRLTEGRAVPSEAVTGAAAEAAAEAATELEALTRGAAAIAIDAPAQLSTAPHAGDTALAPKFRLARCCEIALGREHGLWVPWPAPTPAAPVPGWMRVGLELYQALASAARQPIEVWPHAGFRALAGRTLPPKRSIAGIHQRAALLRGAGIAAEGMQLWSHDAIDAALAALLALRAHEGTAMPVGCGHDRSAIWMPGPA